MLYKLRARLSYANVMATIAVFLALGGTAVATHETILSSDIVDGEVKAQDIGSGQVKTADIGTGQVRGIDVADDSTGFALTGADLAAGSVGESELAAGVVNNSKLGDDAVTSGKVRDDTLAGGGLGAVDLAADAVGESEIAAGGVGSAEMGDGSVTPPKLADGAVTTQKVGNIPAARATKTDHQLIAHATLTALEFESESFDSDNLHDNTPVVGVDNSRLTAPKSGVYQVTAGVKWPYNATGDRFLGLRRNGVYVGGASLVPAQTFFDIQQTASDLVKLNAGEFVQAVVLQSSTETWSALADDSTFLAMTWVGHG